MSTDGSYVHRGWSVPKEGDFHNSDAWGWSHEANRMAVADGASTSSYSDIWSDLLVAAFLDGRLQLSDDPDLFAGQIHALQDEWHGQIPWDHLKQKGWNFIAKAKKGAHSTILGVTTTGAEWDAVIVGDCNLFVVSFLGELKLSWPATDANGFGSYPALIPSLKQSPVTSIFQHVNRAHGVLEPGDSLLLCTDALAAYLLSNRDNTRPWMELLTMSDGCAGEFSSWISRQRKDTRGLRIGLVNDDCTAIIAEFTP